MMGYERFGYGVGHASGFGFGGLIFLFIAAALVTGLIIWLVIGRKHGMMASHAAHNNAYAAKGFPFCTQNGATDGLLCLRKARKQTEHNNQKVFWGELKKVLFLHTL